MYDLIKELKQLMNRLNAVGDYEGGRAAQQAIFRIENLTYDLKMYKEALTGRRGYHQSI